MAETTKRLVLMQGLPGSGKSTVAREIATEARAHGLTAAIRSTDDFWIQPDGTYEFDETKIGLAHRLNEIKATQDMTNGVNVVIIDNTHTKSAYTLPYVQAALEHGYAPEVRRVDPGIEVCRARNAQRPPDRRIPDEVIDRMCVQMEDLDLDWRPEPTIEEPDPMQPAVSALEI